MWMGCASHNFIVQIIRNHRVSFSSEFGVFCGAFQKDTENALKFFLFGFFKFLTFFIKIEILIIAKNEHKNIKSLWFVLCFWKCEKKMRWFYQSWMLKNADKNTSTSHLSKMFKEKVGNEHFFSALQIMRIKIIKSINFNDAKWKT